MRICFIQEKYVSYSFFRRIELQDNEKDLFVRVPISNNTQKIPINIKRLTKFLYNNCINNVVLSQNLLEQNLIKEHFYTNNVNILENRELLKKMANNILELVYSYSGKNIHNGECSITVNDMSNYSVNQIIDLSTKVKRLNIISNNKKQFEKIEDYLYNEQGIMIKVSNNKKVDLIKSDVILNIDYPEELLNEYRLPNKCAIINILHNVEIKKKQFAGININSINIDIPEDRKIEGFKNEDICEAIIYKNEILPDIEIVDLIGKNGIISKSEIISMFA